MNAMDIVIGTIMTIDQAGMQGGHLPPARDRGVAAGDRAGRRGPGEHPAGE